MDILQGTSNYSTLSNCNLTWYFLSWARNTGFLTHNTALTMRKELCWCCRRCDCSVAKSCPTLGNPIGWSMPGFLSFTISWSLPKLMSFESVMLSNHLILCHPHLFLPLIFPNIRLFYKESALRIGDQNIGALASASVLPMNIQGWFPLGLTGWISLQSKRLSRVFSSTTVWKHQFFSAQPSLWSNSHISTWHWKNHSFDYIDLCRQSDVSGF